MNRFLFSLRAAIVALPLIAVGTHYASAEPSLAVPSGVIPGLAYQAPDVNCAPVEAMHNRLVSLGFTYYDVSRPQQDNTLTVVYHLPDATGSIVVVISEEYSCVVAGY